MSYRDIYGNRISIKIGDGIYDKNGDWVYEIEDNRINKTNGDWAYKIRGDQIYDKNGNWFGIDY